MAEVWWKVREADPARVAALVDALKIPDLMAKLLVQRKVDTPDKACAFLSPSLASLDDPHLMLGMPEAVSRLVRAIEKRERVCIYGDYDVDGVTSVSVMMLFLQELGLEPTYRTPSRLAEGYGLHEKHVIELKAERTELLITVDCGISNVKEVRTALEAGMDVIIVDHHQLAEEIPPATAILNPSQPDCCFPTRHLSAVGVCFNLLMALRKELRARGWFKGREEPNLKEYLDLVCLGTIADVVPLTEENRIIAYFGLSELGTSKRPGVAALKEVSGLLSGNVDAGQVAFRLAPRINAAGRLGQATGAVELLTTKSYSRALHLARELDRANQQRQRIEHKMLEEAATQVEALGIRGMPGVLVLGSENWHVGVVGIVASRLAERYDCPTVLLALDGTEGRGSARGKKGVNLYSALQECQETLVSFGGHRLAAGLKLKQDRLDEFRGAFAHAVAKQADEISKEKILQVDGEVQPSSLSMQLIDRFKSLSPYGIGNPEPQFVAKNLTVKSARLVGRGPPYHLKAVLTDRQKTFDAIGFGMGDRLGELRELVDIVYTPGFNNWDGTLSMQLKMRDLKKR